MDVERVQDVFLSGEVAELRDEDLDVEELGLTRRAAAPRRTVHKHNVRGTRTELRHRAAVHTKPANRVASLCKTLRKLGSCCMLPDIDCVSYQYMEKVVPHGALRQNQMGDSSGSNTCSSSDEAD